MNLQIRDRICMRFYIFTDGRLGIALIPDEDGRAAWTVLGILDACGEEVLLRVADQ